VDKDEMPILNISINGILQRFANAAITDPLRSIPGPFLARWTDFPVKIAWLAGRRPQFLHSLHEKYGAIVRVTPDEVDVSDITTAHEIHRVGTKFYKSQFYRRLGPIENLFTTINPKFHSNRRRLLSPFFAESSISKLEPIVMDKVKLTVQKIGVEIQTQGYADVFKWWTLMAMDTIGELSFGESFGLVEAGEVNKYSSPIIKNHLFDRSLEKSIRYGYSQCCAPASNSYHVPDVSTPSIISTTSNVQRRSAGCATYRSVCSNADPSVQRTSGSKPRQPKKNALYRPAAG
jgi:Cytochrome P450